MRLSFLQNKSVISDKICFNKLTCVPCIAFNFFLSLFEMLNSLATKNNLIIDGVDTGLADGIDLGSSEFKTINKQKVGVEQTQINTSDLLNQKYLLIQKGKSNYYLAVFN